MPDPHSRPRGRLGGWLYACAICGVPAIVAFAVCIRLFWLMANMPTKPGSFDSKRVASIRKEILETELANLRRRMREIGNSELTVPQAVSKLAVTRQESERSQMIAILLTNELPSKYQHVAVMACCQNPLTEAKIKLIEKHGSDKDGKYVSRLVPTAAAFPDYVRLLEKWKVTPHETALRTMLSTAVKPAVMELALGHAPWRELPEILELLANPVQLTSAAVASLQAGLPESHRAVSRLLHAVPGRNQTPQVVIPDEWVVQVRNSKTPESLMKLLRNKIADGLSNARGSSHLTQAEVLLPIVATLNDPALNQIAKQKLTLAYPPQNRSTSFQPTVYVQRSLNEQLERAFLALTWNADQMSANHVDLANHLLTIHPELKNYWSV